MIVKLLNEHHLEFLSLKGGCRGSFESTLLKLLEISCCGSFILNREPRLSEAQWSKIHGDIIELQDKVYRCISQGLCHEVRNTHILSLKAPIATKVVCFSRLLKCLRSLYDKQCGPRSDCSYIGAVCSGSTLFASILKLVRNFRQLFAADDFSRRHFQMHFFLGTLRVNQLMGHCLATPPTGSYPH